MKMCRDAVLKRTREVARAFVAVHFDGESSLFDMFWDAFASRWEFEATGSSGTRSAKRIEAVIQAVSFANDNAVDLVTPVVVATVAETARRMNGKSMSVAKIEEVVASAAATFGAGVELAACLVRHLPTLCKEAFAAKKDTDEAIVSRAPAPRLRIWTEGESRIVADIDEYEQRKEEFLFWIDLDEKAHVSPIAANRRIGPQAVALLVYLVAHLGVPVPARDILRDVFEDECETITGDRKDKVEQQLSKLHKFCGDCFRGHLFGRWTDKGLGLKMAFSDKYFFFSRL